jgi:hypothetical protein
LAAIEVVSKVTKATARALFTMALQQRNRLATDDIGERKTGLFANLQSFPDFWALHWFLDQKTSADSS